MAKWSGLQVKYLKWLNTHPSETPYHSDREFAEAMGCHYNSLCGWKRLPGWQEAVKRAKYLVMEDMDTQALAQARILVRQTDNLKDLADYFRFIFPLVEVARATGYLAEFDLEDENYLPQEIVQQEIDKMPLEQQVLFTELLERLDYIKGQQSVVTIEAPEDEVSLYLPVEEIKPVIFNSTRRRRRVEELPAPNPPNKEKYSSRREIEL